MKLLIIPLLVVAIGIGFAAGRYSAPVVPSDAKPVATSTPAVATPEIAKPDARDAEIASLKATVSRQEGELKTLQKKVEEKAAEPKADAPDPNALPTELWDLVKGFKRGK